MSASLRSAAPIGVRQPATDHGQMAASEQRPVKQGHHSRLDPDGPGEHMERTAPTGGAEPPSGRSSVPELGLTSRDCHAHLDLGEHAGRVSPPGGVERPSRRSATLGRRPTAHDRQTGLNLDGVDGHAEQEALTVSPGRPRGVVLPGPRPRPEARPGARFGRWRGVAGLVVCVLALGAAACSVKDAKAEASVSASASASAAIARAEKGIADANASATASREAALTPELRAKRDAALAEPAPAKPSQMNEESPEGAASSVRYFLELYRYAFMTGNTTELAKMSEDRCVFCKSVIDRANDLHKDGGWSNKWEQDVTNIRYYEKLEGYNYNLVHVHISYGQMTWCHPGKNPETAAPIEGQELKFGVRYVNGRWMVGEGEVVSK
mgnify:CR=1 FL=1